MAAYVYILKLKDADRYYVGSCEDIRKVMSVQFGSGRYEHVVNICGNYSGKIDAEYTRATLNQSLREYGLDFVVPKEYQWNLAPAEALEKLWEDMRNTTESGDHWSLPPLEQEETECT